MAALLTSAGLGMKAAAPAAGATQAMLATRATPAITTSAGKRLRRTARPCPMMASVAAYTNTEKNTGNEHAS